jgi:hypothetical protein
MWDRTLPVGAPQLVRNATGSDRALFADTRRSLQLALAGLWLLDGLLQLQPFMFSRAFGTQMLAGVARGNPSDVARSITWTGLAVGHHAVVADTAFASLQVLLALGIAWRPTLKLALAASVAWALAVWWFGEGLGGFFAGTASTVTGAPGAVLLYGLLAVLLWPVDRGGPSPAFIAARAVAAPVARILWVLLWGILACGAVIGANRSARGLHDMISQMASGEPRWLASLDGRVAGLVDHRGLTVAIVLAVLLGLIALGVFLPTAALRITIVVAIVVAMCIWVVGEDFGGLFSGSGTDPNSGPLLVLVALAYWPAREHARRAALAL